MRVMFFWDVKPHSFVLVCPYGGGSRFLPCVGTCLPNYTASHTRISLSLFNQLFVPLTMPTFRKHMLCSVRLQTDTHCSVLCLGPFYDLPCQITISETFITIQMFITIILRRHFPILQINLPKIRPDFSEMNGFCAAKLRCPYFTDA